MEIDYDKLTQYLWSLSEISHDAQLFAIVDCAVNGKIYRALGNSDCEFLCLYKEKLSVEASEAAPYLVLLKRKSSFTKWLIENGWGKSWGIFFTSSKDLFEVVTHFRRFVLVQNEEGEKLYFRFYDPRVLRIFLPTCNLDELKTLLAPTQYLVVEEETAENAMQFRLDGSKFLSMKKNVT